MSGVPVGDDGVFGLGVVVLNGEEGVSGDGVGSGCTIVVVVLVNRDGGGGGVYVRGVIW